MDIHNRPNNTSEHKPKVEAVVEQKTTDNASTYNKLKENVGSLVASDVRLLVLPYCPELAERLYAFSISGAEFMTFCYDTAVFASGMKSLSKEIWSKIESECKLKPQPFDAKKWQQLKVQQESVIKQAAKAKQTVKQIQKEMNQQKGEKSKAHNNQVKSPHVLVRFQGKTCFQCVFSGKLES